jgi:DNA-binding Lrp family transcriptional regulator
LDAYVFIRTEPGLAGTVMESLVASKLAARVVAVSGAYDLIARVERLDFGSMRGRLMDGIHRVPGIRQSNTAFVVPIDAVMGPVPDIGPIPMPFRGRKWPACVALVLVGIQAGSGVDVVGSLARSKRVMGMALITGKNDLMVQVGGASLEAVARIVLRNIQSLAGVASTNTMVVLAATEPTGADSRGKAKGRATVSKRRAARSKPVVRRAATRRRR